jgi:hypothetical protein
VLVLELVLVLEQPLRSAEAEDEFEDEDDALIAIRLAHGR